MLLEARDKLYGRQWVLSWWPACCSLLIDSRSHSCLFSASARLRQYKTIGWSASILFHQISLRAASMVLRSLQVSYVGLLLLRTCDGALLEDWRWQCALFARGYKAWVAANLKLVTLGYSQTIIGVDRCVRVRSYHFFWLDGPIDAASYTGSLVNTAAFFKLRSGFCLHVQLLGPHHLRRRLEPWSLGRMLWVLHDQIFKVYLHCLSLIWSDLEGKCGDPGAGRIATAMVLELKRWVMD